MTAYASGRFAVRLEDMLGPTAIYMPAVTVSFQPDADSFIGLRTYQAVV